MKWKRYEMRLSDGQFTAMKQKAEARGFKSVSAYVQAVVREDFQRPTPEQEEQETFISASVDRLTKEVRTLHNAQQAVFAAVDSLTRLFLTCVPEPPAEALDQAKRRARLRYDRFLLSVAQNMTSDSRATLTELTGRG
jgi:hypothetical protein